MRKRPPQVLVGANFVDLGGTRMHMHSIQKYSSLKVSLAPEESIMALFTPNEFVERFSESFSRINTSNFQAIHSHVFPFFIEWCRKAREKKGTRWIHTHHNWYYPEFGKNGIEEWQAKFNDSFLLAASEADVCLCVSRGQQKFLMREFGLKTFYLPNGVDLEACQKGCVESWIKLTGTQPGFVLFVGRNDPVKDPEFFVQLAQQMPCHRFVIAGQGISHSVIENEWNLKVPVNLDVLGQLSHLEVQHAIAACSVLVLCSRREGLPTLVMEGMVAGKPVVVPDEEGCMEAIGNGQFGFIYKAKDYEDCIRQIELAMRDSTVSASAKSYATKNYDWPHILENLDNIYKGYEPRSVID
jgi:glycosyltransferase involved in cell wall biosynthesis